MWEAMVFPQLCIYPIYLIIFFRIASVALEQSHYIHQNTCEVGLKNQHMVTVKSQEH